MTNLSGADHPKNTAPLPRALSQRSPNRETRAADAFHADGPQPSAYPLRGGDPQRIRHIGKQPVALGRSGDREVELCKKVDPQ